MAARSVLYLSELRRATIKELMQLGWHSTQRRGLTHKLHNVTAQLKKQTRE